MIGVATKKKYFDDSSYSWWDGRDGLIGLESISRFKMIKNQITDKKKQIKYKRIYLGFLLSVILAPVSFGIAILMLL